MPYGMSDADYAREVDRKLAAGEKLTAPLDKAAYERGKAALSGGGGSTGASPSRSTSGNTFTEGSLTYVRNPDGSVTKLDTSTGRAVTIPAGDPRMAYIPQEIGGTRASNSNPAAPGFTEDDLYNYVVNALQQPRFNYEIPEFRFEVPTLSYSEALSRAKSQLNPLYERELEKTLEAVDQDTIRRGFFGQLPAGALRAARAAEVESAKAAAISALANQMVGQSEEAARAAQQLALQKWNTEAQLRLQAAQNAYGQQQDALRNVLALLQLRQEAEEAEKDRQARLELEKLPWTLGMTPYEQAQVAVSRLRATSSGSGGTKAPTKTDWEGAVMSVADYYKRPEDYLADLKRYKKEIIQLVGPTGYNRLINSAQEEVDNWDMSTYGSRWVPGKGSPLREALSAAGVM